MSLVRILNETENTVTISREDWLKLQEQLEDAKDQAAIAERRAHERRVGRATARRNYLTAHEAIRLLNGESPVRIWRQKRHLSQRALAAEAGIGSSYLAEIETNRKAGSDRALRKLAAALNVSSAELDIRRYRTRDLAYGPVILRSSPISSGVSPGNRTAWADRMDFPTVGDALDFAREEWASLRARSPRITDVDNWPIYDAEELFREIEE
jgi:transcriptional regulator with XRE-family HTH domain